MALPMTKPEDQMSIAECDALLTMPGSPFEVEEVTIKGRTQKVWKNAPPTYRTVMMAMYPTWADREFLSAPLPEPAAYDDRENVTFAQVYERALDFAAWLRSVGVKQGSRVALGGLNSIGWVVAFTALHLLGAVPVLLNSTLHNDAHAHCLKTTEPVLVLVDEPLAKQFGPQANKLLKGTKVGPIYCLSSVQHLSPSVRKAIKEYPNKKGNAKVIEDILEGVGIDNLGPESHGMIFFTSGTTSMPKAVLSTQRAGLHNVISSNYTPARAALRAGLGLADLQEMAANPQVACMLVSIPVFHVTGCLAILLKAITSGGKLVFQRRWSVEDAVKLIVKEKVNVVGGVPAIATAILQSPLLPKDQQFLSIAYGGAPPANRLAGDLIKRFPQALVGQGWGMTETNATHTHLIGPDYVERPTSCGPCLPITEVKIVHPETKKEVPTGSMGIVFARGSNIMTEYVNNPKATREVLSADGWLDTGDMGFLDADGFLHLQDRAKDIIIRGGENIPSAEVENALAQDDRLAEVAAVAVPDPVLGERVGAGVSLAPGAKATEKEIIEAVQSRLRHPARPVIVVVFPEPLPRNANGKIVKADVKKIVQTEWKKRHRAPKAKL